MIKKITCICLSVFLGICLFSPEVRGDINNLKLTANPGDFATKKYNGGQTFIFTATWDAAAGVATAPFAATLKVNSSTIVSSNEIKGEAAFSVNGSMLAEGANNFTVSVLETSVLSATPSQEVALGGSINIDKTPPVVSATIVSGGVVSPQPGFNEVVFQFTSNEPLAKEPDILISPAISANPVATPAPVAPFTSIQYKLSVPAGAKSGNYTVTFTGRDATDGSNQLNKGTAQISFTVKATADGSPSITSSNPTSPTKTTSIELSGSLPAESGNQKIEVLDNGVLVKQTPVDPNATTWTVFITNLSEGTHKYTARRIDSLGNTSAPGNEMQVIADRTAPAVPELASYASPINTQVIRLTGKKATDEPHKSFPVKVSLYRTGVLIATTNASPEGDFTFNDVALEEGVNILSVQAADTTYDGGANTGNLSAFSQPALKIVLDRGAPVVVGGGVIISVPGSGGPPKIVAIPSPNASPQSEQKTPNSAGGPVSKTFEPPSGSSQKENLEIKLPLASLMDRYPKGVNAFILSRPTGIFGAQNESMQLSQTSDNFVGNIPLRNTGAIYRFQLIDKAGNSSFFPANGEFLLNTKRTSMLRMPIYSRFYGMSITAADEWPVEVLGFPSIDRLLSYRRIYTHSDLIPKIQQLLSSSGNAGSIEILDQANADETPPSWKKDLELAGQKSLPENRADLLFEEIKSGAVPLDMLPDPEKMSDKPAFRNIRDAIRFRFAHEKLR